MGGSQMNSHVETIGRRGPESMGQGPSSCLQATDVAFISDSPSLPPDKLSTVQGTPFYSLFSLSSTIGREMLHGVEGGTPFIRPDEHTPPPSPSFEFDRPEGEAFKVTTGRGEMMKIWRSALLIGAVTEQPPRSRDEGRLMQLPEAYRAMMDVGARER